MSNIYIDAMADVELIENSIVVDNDGIFNDVSGGFGYFIYDVNKNIVGICGHSLKVLNLTNENGGKPYFQAFVNDFQNDGYSHNEAVKNAFNSVKYKL
jgi:hypothetical protein